MGDRYQLKHKCMFVDAFKRDGANPGRKPDKIPHPHVLDQSSKPAKYKILNDDYGFVARFIVQGLDTDVIKQIVISEYGNQVADPGGLVQEVVTALAPYLEPRVGSRQFDAHPAFTSQDPKNFEGRGYGLNFRVNWFGTGCCKF